VETLQKRRFSGNQIKVSKIAEKDSNVIAIRTLRKRVQYLHVKIKERYSSSIQVSENANTFVCTVDDASQQRPR
jgi:hypothetical protein